MNGLYYCILHGCFVQAVEQNLEVLEMVLVALAAVLVDELRSY